MRRRFHKNLHLGLWTMSGKDCPATHLTAVYLEGVTIKQPNPDNKKVKVAHNGGKRSVHCWFWSSAWRVDDLPKKPASAKRILYNPKPPSQGGRGDTFFNIDGRQVDALARVWLLEDGTCWGIDHNNNTTKESQ